MSVIMRIMYMCDSDGNIRLEAAWLAFLDTMVAL